MWRRKGDTKLFNPTPYIKTKEDTVMNSTLSIASFDDDDNYLEVLSLKKKNRQLIKNAKRQSLSLMLTRIFMATALTVMAAVTLISLGRAKILQEQVRSYRQLIHSWLVIIQHW